MKTKDFLNLLQEHSNKSLLFEYKEGFFVAPNYHITEVKNVSIDSVDCGAGVDAWKETIIQLWESPEEKGIKEYMSAFKALGILKKVDSIKPMERDVEVKFEYSNPNFHTGQLVVQDFGFNDTHLVFKLAFEHVDCKAKEACGIPAETATEAQSGCAPGSGCC